MTASRNEAQPLDRNGLEVLAMDECLALAGSVPIARVAVNGPGTPMVVPVTHAVLGSTIAFRSASGSKLDAAIMNDLVTIEVDDWDLATRTGWSVILRGSAELIEDMATLEELADLVDEPWIQTTREMSWVRVRPNEITGRRIASTGT